MLIFPQNTNTLNFIVTGNSTTSVAVYTGTPNIILSVAMQQEKDLSDTVILCGTDIVAKNYGKDYPQVFYNYSCLENISILKTGNDEAFVSIQILDSSSTTPLYYNGFSYDGIFIGSFLFFIFCILFFGGIWKKTVGVKTKVSQSNEILGNNSQEGKIIYYD